MGAVSGVAEYYRIDRDLQRMTNYAELCGDSVEMIELSEDETCDDLKVTILKASEPEKYIKDVGIKIRDNKFAVYREEGEPSWKK